MNKSELKKILPKGFKNSKFDKSALSMIQNSIEMSIRVEKSTFWGTNFESEALPKIIIIISIEVYDKYSTVFEQGHPLHIMETSLNLGNEIVNLGNYGRLFHWENEDISSIKEAIDNNIIPWLNWITTPDVLIEYLKCLEATVIESDIPCSQFSSLLNSLEDYPVNARKNFNSTIATLYEEIGNYQNAIKHLIKHKEYVISDFPASCKVKSMVEAQNKKLRLIDEGIHELKDKLCQQK